MRHAPLNEEQRLRTFATPVRKPVAALLHRSPVEVDVDRMEVVEIAGLMVVDRARRVYRLCNRPRLVRSAAIANRALHTSVAGLWLEVVFPVHPLRIHIARIAREIVVHRVCDDARMVTGAADAPLGEGAIPRRDRRIFELHPEVAHMRQGEREEHSHLVADIEEVVHIGNLTRREVVVARDDIVEAHFLEAANKLKR